MHFQRIFSSAWIRLWVNGFAATGIVLCSCWLFSHAAQAQPPPEAPLNPRRFLSPSGRWALNVDPADRFGRGEADNRLEHDGTLVWSARLPFTLREAEVGEDGTAVGCSYSSGLQGGRGLDGDKGLGSLRLLILDPRDGSLRLQEKIERHFSSIMHAPPEPTVNGLLLDETGGRFIAQLGGGAAEETWRVYRLSDGHALDKISPAKVLPRAKGRAFNLVNASRMVPGTPLMLWQWDVFGSAARAATHFLLYDLDKRTVVWSTDFPAAKSPADAPGAPDATRALLDKRRNEAILQTGPADAKGSRFALWSVATREQVAYHVTQQGGRQNKVKWTVAEEARTPLQTPPPDPVEVQSAPLLSLPDAPDAPLKPIGVFHFPADAPAPPAIRSIQNFGFDAQGNIGLLRVEGDHAAFVLVDPKENGAVRREIDLPALNVCACTAYLTWLEGARWLVVPSKNATDTDQDKSLTWTVDASTGAATPCMDWDVPRLFGVSGVGDGRFVALAHHDTHYPDGSMSPSESLINFDRQGHHQWTVEGSNDTLFSPEDVATLIDGKTAAVIETIRNDVLIFDLASGKLLRKINLKKAWGHEPTYPAEIAADRDGGFIVGDWQNSTAPYVRCGADGHIRAVVTPRYADGRLVDGHSMPMRADPAGRLWMSDRDALLRLDERGQVDIVLGEPREAARLGTVGQLTVDDDGRLYAVSARTGNVFVFDESGREQLVCRPDPQDVPDQADTFNVAVDSARHVFLDAGRYGLAGSYDQEPPPQIEFGADGQRIGTRQMHLGATCQQWRFSPDGKRLLASTFDEVRLIDAATAHLVRSVDRQFDRRWLDRISPEVACAPDGSFAVTSALQGESAQWALNLYAANGEARRMVRLPPELDSSFVAYDGQRVITLRKDTNRVVMFGNDGAAPRGYTVEMPPGDRLGGRWRPWVVHGGRELWLVCQETKTVARFGWPP